MCVGKRQRGRDKERKKRETAHERNGFHRRVHKMRPATTTTTTGIIICSAVA